MSQTRSRSKGAAAAFAGGSQPPGGQLSPPMPEVLLPAAGSDARGRAHTKKTRVRCDRSRHVGRAATFCWACWRLCNARSACVCSTAVHQSTNPPSLPRYPGLCSTLLGPSNAAFPPDACLPSRKLHMLLADSCSWWSRPPRSRSCPVGTKWRSAKSGDRQACGRHRRLADRCVTDEWARSGCRGCLHKTAGHGAALRVRAGPSLGPQDTRRCCREVQEVVKRVAVVRPRGRRGAAARQREVGSEDEGEEAPEQAGSAGEGVSTR